MDGGYAASLVEYSPGCARARSRGRAGGAARFVSFLGLRRAVGLGEGAARPVLLLTQRIWTEEAVRSLLAARLLPAGRLGPGCFVSIGGGSGCWLAVAAVEHGASPLSAKRQYDNTHGRSVQRVRSACQVNCTLPRI